MFWGVVPLEAIRDAAGLIGGRTFPRYKPKFSSWGKGVICQVVDVDPITVLGNFKNG